MNERIAQFILDAGFVHYGEDMGSYNIPVPAFKQRMEMFAELIIKECCLVAGPEDSYTDEWFKAKVDSIAKIKKNFGVEE